MSKVAETRARRVTIFLIGPNTAQIGQERRIMRLSAWTQPCSFVRFARVYTRARR